MKKAIYILTTILISLTMFSCATVKEIPEDKTSAQIIQMGQNCVTAANYKDAEFYFTTAIKRYGSDSAVYAEASYELAHAYMKQKKYDKAYPIFTELLDMYSEDSSAFPPAYKKLCQIGIQSIPEAKLKLLQGEN